MRDLVKLAPVFGVVRVVLAGCDARESAARVPAGKVTSVFLDADASGVMLLFEERGADIEPYRTRFIVTHRYLRIDDDPRVEAGQLSAIPARLRSGLLPRP